jgi:2-C-methyl-D-erythritol 4-phosphate cytidylyltransferase
MNEYALIVAGGSGKRMNSSLPKQFIELAGLPILMHTINAFIQYSRDINIVLVLPENQIGHWHELVKKHNFKQPIQLVEGGASRNKSVRNGLEVIKEAYAAISNKGFTDDASVAEANGHNIALINGDYRNIKITTPEDIIIAQALFDKD